MKFAWLYLSIAVIAGVIIIWIRHNSTKVITNTQIKQIEHHFSYHFKNIALPSEESTEVLIDHLLVSKTGIFIIQVIDRNGIIVGEEPAKMWTEQLKSKQQSFANPTLINLKALPILRSLLNDPIFHIPVYPVVVFGKKANLDQVFCESTVLKCIQLKNYLSSLSTETLTPAELEQIKQVLSTL